MSRDVASGLVDVATILIASGLLLSLLTPLRLVLGLSTSARNVFRRDAVASAFTDQDFGDIALQIAGAQVLLILVFLWILAVPLGFAYASLATTIAGGTLGRLVTRTRLRNQQGDPLRGAAIAKLGLATAVMWLVPVLVLIEAVVYVATLGKTRLRVGQRMVGAHAVTISNKGDRHAPGTFG